MNTDEPHDFDSAFNEIADWAEAYFERRYGREAGMSFGGLVRVMRDRATHGADPTLDRKLERLMLQFLRFYLDRTRAVKPVLPDSQRTNMIYDPGPSAK